MTGIFTIRVLLLQFFHAWILHNCGAQISLDETLLTAELLKYFLHEACVGWSSSISAIETCFFWMLPTTLETLQTKAFKPIRKIFLQHKTRSTVPSGHFT